MRLVRTRDQKEKKLSLNENSRRKTIVVPSYRGSEVALPAVYMELIKESRGAERETLKRIDDLNTMRCPRILENAPVMVHAVRSRAAKSDKRQHCGTMASKYGR